MEAQVRAIRRWAVVPLVVLALSLAGLAATGSGITGRVLPPPPPSPRPPPSPEPAGTVSPSVPPREEATERIRQATPEWLEWLITGLVVGTGLAALGLIIYVGVRYLLTERVRRRRLVDQAASQPDEPLADAEEIREALRAGLSEIDAGGDPRRAVIACWLRLERIAAAAGAARLAADTPTDLVQRLLSRHRVVDRALDRLASAYRLARYAPVTIGDDLVVTAREALVEVAAALPVRAARTGAGDPRGGEARDDLAGG